VDSMAGDGQDAGSKGEGSWTGRSEEQGRAGLETNLSRATVCLQGSRNNGEAGLISVRNWSGTGGNRATGGLQRGPEHC
jgi:hypothetical protein